MSKIDARREFTDRLLARLGQDAPAPQAGDFAAICTDLVQDAWELFPIAIVAGGVVFNVHSEMGGLLAVHSIAERDQVVVCPARDFPDLQAVRSLCWIPIDGLAQLRMRLHKLRAD